MPRLPCRGGIPRPNGMLASMGTRKLHMAQARRYPESVKIVSTVPAVSPRISDLFPRRPGSLQTWRTSLALSSSSSREARRFCRAYR